MKWRSAAPPVGGIYFLLAGILTALLFYYDVTWAAAPLAAITTIAAVRSVPSILIPQFCAGILLGAAALTLAAPPEQRLPEGGILTGHFNFKITDWGGVPVERSLVSAQICPGGEKVLLRLPPGTAPFYGDMIAANALLAAPSPPTRLNFLDASGRIVSRKLIAPGGFDRYMRNRDITAVANLTTVDTLTPGHGVLHTLAKMRAKLAARIAEGMDRQSAKIVNAIVLGVRQGIDSEERSDFLKSGTIHLFSVSGLHVGVAAALALMLFSPAPWRLRAPAMLAAVWFYTLLSGAQIPALRAALMISCFIVARSYFSQVRPLSTLALAAAAVLLWQPKQLFDLGFQFSFVITGFLLLTGEAVGKLSKAVNEQDFFKPPELIPRRKIAAKSIGLAAVLAVIYLAGMPLSLYHQGLFTPGSLPANLLIMPLIFPLFLLAALKIMPGIGILFAEPLNSLSEILRSVAGGAAELFSDTPTLAPEPWLTVIFMVALLLFMRSGSAVRVLATAVMFGWIAFVFGGHFFLPDFMLVVHGGDDAATCIAASPSTVAAYSLNLPGYDAAPPVREFLFSRGIRRIEGAMLMPKTPEPAAAALNMTGRIAVCGKPRNPEKLVRWTSLSEKSAIWLCGPALFELKNKIAVLDYHHIKIELKNHPDGGTEVSYGTDAALELWNNLYPEIYVYEYEK